MSLISSLTSPVRAGFQTALFVSQVLNLPIQPQSWFTARPVRREVNYPQGNGTGAADIYRVPAKKPRAAVLIFLGANAEGRDDDGVIRLGNALARAGLVAMFHWSPAMALRHNLDPTEIDNLVWAFQYLAGTDFVDPHRVGMGGFCVGASFALVAAADARIRDQVAFVSAFGPFFDARDLLVQLASRSRLYGGRQEPWDPDQLALRVFGNELIDTLDDSQEREVLRGLLLNGQELPDGQLERLSPAARRVQRLLQGTTVEEAERNYLKLPAGFREGMRSISPSAHIDEIRARVNIMHGKDDRLVPAAESRRLADALADRTGFRYTEVLAFEHVRPATGRAVWKLARDGFKLYRHMYGIVQVAN